MKAERDAFLKHLKGLGEANDRVAPTRADKMLNITADTGLMIWMLIRAWKPRRMLEIGTSNGYSTIWWADALSEPEQELVTLEANPRKITLAQDNFRKAGVMDQIQVVAGDATTFLQSAVTAAWDLIFLDAERAEYVHYWPDLTRILAPEGLLVVDNAVDKATELEAFRRVVEDTPAVRQVLVPIGNGELLIQKDGLGDLAYDATTQDVGAFVERAPNRTRLSFTVLVGG